MTKDQVIELAKQAGIQGCYSPEVVAAFRHFSQLVRNSALEEAAKACQRLEIAIDGGGNSYYRPADARQCVEAIRAMKEKI